MTNKYDILSIKSHIKMVQDAHQVLQSDKDRGLKISTFAKRASELGEMKYYLMRRLEAMDRNIVSFFPVGAHVEYVHPLYSQKEKVGVVINHIDGEWCLCTFDGDNYEVKVDPKHLKLRFIRSNYPF